MIGYVYTSSNIIVCVESFYITNNDVSVLHPDRPGVCVSFVSFLGNLMGTIDKIIINEELSMVQYGTDIGRMEYWVTRGRDIPINHLNDIIWRVFQMFLVVSYTQYLPPHEFVCIAYSLLRFVLIMYPSVPGSFLRSSQYPIRHLIVLSCKVSKARDRILWLCNCPEIWHASRQHSLTGVCIISNQYEHFITLLNL